MRIDAHHHLWDLDVRDQPWTAELPALRRSFGIDELRPALVASEMDATVLVQTISVADETPELLAIADAEPVIAGVVGWIDLSAPDAADELARLMDGEGGGRLVGIRHQVQEEPDPRWLCRADVRPGLAAVGEAGLAYDLLVKPQQLASAVDIVRALPDMRFVLDHAGKPAIRDRAIQPWQAEIAELAQLPNVAVKLSGLVTEAADEWTVEQLRPFVDVLLQAFEPSRIMFGSDWPVCLLAASYREVVAAAQELTAQLSSAERADVFGETAARWYGIG
ncbi:MAG TPA: amidohydrolase family protein [Streptosporangiaceae bacterium]